MTVRGHVKFSWGPLTSLVICSAMRKRNSPLFTSLVTSANYNPSQEDDKVEVRKSTRFNLLKQSDYIPDSPILLLVHVGSSGLTILLDPQMEITWFLLLLLKLLFRNYG